MTKKVEKETERMLKGEIHFYNKGDKVCPVKKYKFSDAFLVYFSETFYAFGTENMKTTLILSPAIQNYGVQLVKHWQVSWIPPSEPNYYVPKKEEEEENILKNINGHFYTKNGVYLGKIGEGDNVYIADEAAFENTKQTGKADDDKVIFFTDKYKLNHQQLLDRANWIYAEGGYKIPEYYAYTIENALNDKNIGKGLEDKIYFWLMQDTDPKTSKTRHLDSEKYFSGGYENQTGKRFFDLRKTPTKFDTDMQNTIAAVIKSKHFPEKDPTGGTNSWLGYKNGAHTGEYFISSLGSRHFFIKVEPGKKGQKTNIEREYKTIK